MSDKVLQALLRGIDELAAQEGMPTYDALQERLQQAQQHGDNGVEMEALVDIGARLSSIAAVAHALKGQPGTEGVFPDPVEVSELAAKYFRDLLETANRAGDKNYQKIALQDLGDYYLSMDKNDSALEYLRRALDLSLESGDEITRYNVFWKLGNCCFKLEQDSEALSLYQQALQVARTIDDPAAQADQLGKIASAFFNLSHLEEALSYYEQARDLLTLIGHDEALQAKIILNRNLLKATGLEASIQYTNERITLVKERIRLYSAIAALPKIQLVRYRHANHYLNKLGDISDQFKQTAGTERLLIFAQFEQEWRQIQSGRDWAHQNFEQFEIAADMCIDYALSATSLRDIRVSAQENLSWSLSGLTIAEQRNNLSAQCHLLINAGYEWQDLGDTQKALNGLEKALRLSREIGDHKSEGLALIALGGVFGNMGRNEDALRSVERGRELIANSKQLEVDDRYLANQVNIYVNMGHYGKALELGKRDLEIARQQHDTARQAKALGNLGLIYHALIQYQSALEYHQQALALARQIGDRPGELSDLMNAGIANMELEQFEDAQKNFESAWAIARELGNQASEEGILGNLGHLYRMTGQYEKAIENFENAMLLAKERQHRQGESNALNGMGNVHFMRKDYEQALVCYNDALQIAHEINSPADQTSALLTLANCYILLGDYDRAILMLKDSIEIARSAGYRAQEGLLLHTMAIAFKGKDQTQQALEHAQQAREIFEALELNREIESNDFLISQLLRLSGDVSSNTHKDELYNLFRTWTNIPVIDAAQSKTFLLTHKDVLLTDEGQGILQLLLRTEPDNRLLQLYFQLLKECRSEGIEKAYDSFFQEVAVGLSIEFMRWRDTPEAEIVISKVIKWASLPNKELSKQYLLANKDELFTVNVMFLLDIFGDKAKNPEGYLSYQIIRELFVLCRKEGVEKAYDSFDTLLWHEDMLNLVTNWFRAPVEAYLIQNQARLLTDEAEYVVSEIASQSHNWAIDLYLQLVRRARKVGISKAAKEFQEAEQNQMRLESLFIEWMNKTDWEEKRRFTHQHADDLLSDAAEEVIGSLIEIESEPVRSGSLKVHRILLTTCRQTGIDKGFELQEPRNLAQYTNHIAALFTEWMICTTLEESKTYLEQHSDDLLTEWAKYLAEQVMDRMPDQPIIAQHLSLLNECLAVGIDEGYIRLKHYWQE